MRARFCHHLVIGNFPSSKDEEFIVRKNVKYILNLTGELSEGQIEGVEYKSVMIEDEEEEELEPHLEECCKFINKAKSSKDKKQTPVSASSLLLWHIKDVGYCFSLFDERETMDSEASIRSFEREASFCKS